MTGASLSNDTSRDSKWSPNLEKSPFLGILQVNTSFHRPPGDVGNLATWSIPVKIKVVTEASSDEVVTSSRNYSPSFVENWVNAALELVDEGAIAIITLCGFLATMHPVLQSKLSVPLGTSALLQVPFVLRLVPQGKKIGVITFDAANLGVEHLRAVGVAESDIANVPIVGVKPNGKFQRILREGEKFDYGAVEAEVLEAAQSLIEENDDIGGIVLECTNIPPYKAAIHRKTGLPVWDIITLGNFLYEAALPAQYSQNSD